jgi:hypothetical protein
MGDAGLAPPSLSLSQDYVSLGLTLAADLEPGAVDSGKPSHQQTGTGTVGAISPYRLAITTRENLTWVKRRTGKFTAFVHQNWKEGSEGHGDYTVESLADLDRVQPLAGIEDRRKSYAAQPSENSVRLLWLHASVNVGFEESVDAPIVRGCANQN